MGVRSYSAGDHVSCRCTSSLQLTLGKRWGSVNVRATEANVANAEGNESAVDDVAKALEQSEAIASLIALCTSLSINCDAEQEEDRKW